MIEQIITSIVCLILALIIGYSLGDNENRRLEKKNFKLEIQNQVLKREYNKLCNIIEHFKDKRNEVIVDDKLMIIYAPLDGEEKMVFSKDVINYD